VVLGWTELTKTKESRPLLRSDDGNKTKTIVNHAPPSREHFVHVGMHV